MKEFVLSLLSRGCSHVVRTDGSSQCGRMEICFEPEDYFIWKSQPPLLRLSNSGQLLSGVESAPPKTYSSRKGPLILYSEDFALSSCQADKVNRKGQGFRSFGEEAKVQFPSLRDLTEAALAYGVKQARVGGHTCITQPPLPVPKPTTKHLQSYRRLGEEQKYLFQITEEDYDHASSGALGNAACHRSQQARYQPRFLCSSQPHRPPPGPLPLLALSTAPRCSLDRPHLEPGAHSNTMPKGPDGSSLTQDRINFSTDVGVPRVWMSPVPKADAWEKQTGQPEEQKNMLLSHQIAESLTGLPKDFKGHWNWRAMGTGGEEDDHSLRPAYMDLSLEYDHLSKATNNRKHTDGAWQPCLVKRSVTELPTRKVIPPSNPSLNIHHLPPIKHKPHSNTKEHGLKAGTTQREIQKDTVPRLPDIQLPDICTEDTGPIPPEQTFLKKVFNLLPPSVEQEGLCGLPEEAEIIEDVLCGEVKQKESIRTGEDKPLKHGRRLKAAEQDQLIWFEPDEDKEPQMTQGPLPPFVGRRGLGKQCSMALYRQEPCDPTDQAEPQSGITRGSVPLELRECQKGGVMGTLIMGPAGEIIRLSFWDPLTETRDHPALEDAMQEPVLRVMTSEGVLEQPWTILLEEQTQTEVNGSKLKKSFKKQVIANQIGFELKDADSIPTVLPKFRAPDGFIATMKKAKDLDRDERRTKVDLHPPSHLYTANAPEKRSEKIAHSAQHQSHSNGEDIKKQMRGSTQRQQPEGRARPGSSKPTSEPANNLRKANLSTPTATDVNLHEAKPTSQAAASKERVNASSSKAGGTNKSEPQMRKVKEEEDQQEKKVTMNEYEEGKRIKPYMDSKSLETGFIAETSPGAIPKKSKKAANENSKTETNKSQKLVKKGKKKSKRQAAFIVGKPRSSQEGEQIVKKTSRPEKTFSNTGSNETDSEDDQYLISTGHEEIMDVCQDKRGADSNLVDNQSLQETCIFKASLDSASVSLEPEHNLDDDQIFALQDSYVPAGSSRSHSCVSKSSSGTWSFRRTSMSTDTDLFSPVPDSFTHLSIQSAGPNSQASSTSRSEPTADHKISTEATNQKDSKALAEKAERRKLAVERKRKEKEEEKKWQHERDEREERMRLELEEEQKQRADQTRFRKLQDEEEKHRKVEREMERQRIEQAEMEKDKKRQEEKRKLLEKLQKKRLEEEAQRAAQLRQQQQEEEARREEEWRRLQEMGEHERLEYLRQKQEEEEERKNILEMRRHAEQEAAMRAEEEARLLIEHYNRQKAVLEQQLQFHRGLFVESEGLYQTQDISRPWVFSYFSLMKLLGVADGNAI